MKILILVENLNRRGGATKAARSLFSQLNSGCDIVMHGCYSSNLLGVSTNLFIKLILIVCSFFSLLIFLYRNKVSHVVCTHFIPIVLIYLLRFFYFRRLKVIYWIHTNPHSYFSLKTVSARVFSLIIPFILKSSTGKVVFVSKESEVQFKSKYGEVDSATIYNLIEYEKKSNIPRRENKKLLYVGSFEKVKRLDLLLNALANVDHEITLSIVGGDLDSVSFNKLNNVVHQLNIESRVSFFGHCDPVPHFLEASALILTSEAEGYPLVFNEANSFNLPVISLDFSSGPREYLCSGLDLCTVFDSYKVTDFGIIVSNKDPLTNLGFAIEFFFNGDLNYKKMINDIKAYQSLFDKKTILSSWYDLLEGKLEGKPGSGLDS